MKRHFAKPPGRCTQAGQRGNKKQWNPAKQKNEKL
jgi:hypothetical protein